MTTPLNKDASQSQSIRSSITEKQKPKFTGFDYLRSIFSIAIVADHAGLFMLATVLGLSSLTDILYANFSYLAVPVFFQISLFLFYLKNQESGFQYFIQKRLPKLIYLYIFWVIAKILCDLLIKGNSEAIKMASTSVRGLLEAIVSGGNSPFYFFFSLLFITTLAQFFILTLGKLKIPSIKAKISYFSTFFSCILISSFSVFSLNDGNSINNQIGLLSTLSNIAQWNYNPLNFLPYIFTGAILSEEFKEGKIERLTPKLKLKLYGLLVVFLVFTLLEWNILKNLTQYSRPSLVFGSWLLLYLALLSTRKPAATVTFISNCSLGIYGFHLLFTHILFSDNKTVFISLSQGIPGLDLLVEFCVALVGSIALTVLFRRIKFLKLFV